MIVIEKWHSLVTRLRLWLPSILHSNLNASPLQACTDTQRWDGRLGHIGRRPFAHGPSLFRSLLAEDAKTIRSILNSGFAVQARQLVKHTIQSQEVSLPCREVRSMSTNLMFLFAAAWLMKATAWLAHSQTAVISVGGRSFDQTRCEG